MIKIDKEFLLTDDSVNCYGYRLITAGLQLERCKPFIGFLMHDREKGVAVKWEDHRLENGALYAKPVVNEKLFPDLAQQIEEGFYQGASVGHIVPLEVDDTVKIEGQTGPTITKWFFRECSICDIPGNYSALARLYDESGNELQDLTDFNKKNMTANEATFKVSELGLPNLKADASIEDIRTHIQSLTDKANKYDNLKAEYDGIIAKHTEEKIDGILEQGLADHKLTKQMAERLKADYKDNADGLKALVDAMPKQTLLTDRKTSGEVPEKYAGKSFHDLFVSGELAEVKKLYPDYYETLKNSK